MISARPRLLVTGGSGFIGSAIRRAALASGLDVIGLSRHPAAIDAGLVRGDLADRATLASAMRGIDVVIHAAGLAHRPAGAPDAEFLHANEAGTRAVVETAAAAGVGRVVVVSSVAVYGPDATVANEDTPCRPAGVYAVSKWRGEMAAREVAARTGLSLAIVRPATVIGAGDPGSLARLARQLLARRILALPEGRARKCVIDVDDVASASLRLALSPDDAEVYNLAGGPVTLDEIVAVLVEALDLPPPRLRVPGVALRLGLAALSPVAAHVRAAGMVAHAIRAWLADQIYETTKYEARYGPLIHVDWRTAVRREAQSITAGRSA